ncbi:MAG TPA: DoxX family protein [Longimicrobiaceae bacterium]|nr:DoxX family protein [Longimicrobiaceae bacterium]
MPATTRTPSERKINVVLWTVQVLLALLFVFAGGMKLVAPPELLKGPGIEFPVLFIRFIGVCELAGGLGLVLPGLLRIRTALTPLAAAGLVIIMVGATSVTVIGGMGAGALFPFVVGILAASVAYGRTRRIPLRTSPRRLVLQPAA